MQRTLRSSHTIASDILTDVYDWFFTHEVFVAWRDARTTWQLHCIGGPGAGKTTLTALISQHLRAHPEAKEYPIVSIFVDSDVPNHQSSVIEDFLAKVYHKLAEDRFIEEDQSDDLYEEFSLARLTVAEGSRVRSRLRLIRDALHMRLQALKNSRSFLLLDGIDRCESTLRLLLEEELAHLQNAGLSILLTSRLAVFEQDVGVCDHRNHGGAPDDDPLLLEDREASSLFQVCRTCGDLLCFTCKEAGRICGKCGNNDGLYEHYDHVNVRLSIPPTAMRRFIAWSLELEHGDLGLGSSARKPPLSPLGKSLALSKLSKPIQKHADNVLEFSNYHIGIAKARLDMIHEMDSLDKLEMRKDELPASITMIFNMGLGRIETQHVRQRDLALKALAACADFDNGVEIPDLRAQLKSLGVADVRSGEDILEATRGFLSVTTRVDPQRLEVFNHNLVYYIKQKYHRALHRASVQLNAPKARFEPQNVSGTATAITPYKISRSITGLQRIPESSQQPFIIRKGTRAWA